MKIIQAVSSIVIAQMAGVVGSFCTFNNVATWYSTLSRPSWNPPSWIFGPVWLTLYAVIGYSAFLVWEKRKEDARAVFALWIYGVHLVLNAAWSIIFFGLQSPRAAFFEILILDVLIVFVTILFWRISRTAGILLLPYMAWVFFATYLNYTIWMLN